MIGVEVQEGDRIMAIVNAPNPPDPASTHVLMELGFGVTREGDELHGSAPIVPEMLVPGTDCLRTSILATWTDTVAGLLVVDVVRPRVPVTLELDVHLYEPPRDCGSVQAVGRLAKVGRSVVVPTVELMDEHGTPLGFGTGSFMVAPDPELRMPDTTSIDQRHPGDGRLAQPLAERVGLELRAPGVAVLPHTADGLNASNTMNGGLLALAVEEAALSLTPGATIASLALRYLQPVRFGPAVATAEVRDGLGRVEVVDAGNAHRRAVLATTRIFSRAG